MTETTAAFHPHDHGACIADGLSRAEDVARRKGLRFTPVRRRTLEILLQRHGAMGAYDVLDCLREDGFSAQPPVAYRALDFLVEHGFAHRIRRLNAFAACSHPGEDHSAAFLICRGCDAVAELAADPLRAALEQGARTVGFSVERANIEALGLCPVCQSSQAAEGIA